jgi:hypothetical protein
MKGQKVEVYLNKKAMGKSRKRIYSLRHATGKNRGKVAASSKRILMRDVEFVVREAGRQDTLQRMNAGNGPNKTVHAFLRGTVVARGNHALSFIQKLGLKLNRSIRYNPQSNTSFVSGDTAIHTAEWAWVYEDDILV